MLEYLKENTVIRVTLYFVLITIVLCSFVSNQIIKTRRDIQEARGFFEAGEFVYLNFEENLRSYQRVHKKIIYMLGNVRPTEEAIVPFINALENLGKTVDLEVKIRNLEAPEEGTTQEVSNFIKYNISSYGTEEQMTKYLEEIEKLPYYIRTESVLYQKSSQNERSELPNINIVLKLYIK